MIPLRDLAGSVAAWPGRWSVASRTLVLQGGSAIVVVMAGLCGAWWQAEQAAEDDASDRAMAIAQIVASTPSVIGSVSGPSPTDWLERYSERVRAVSHTDFVIIMNSQGVRFTYLDPSQIGKRFEGTIAAAQRGGIVQEEYTGTLGPSTRVVVPVLDDGEVVGLVSVGIPKTAAGEHVRAELPGLLLAALAAAAMIGLGPALVSGRTRRQALGLGEGRSRALSESYAQMTTRRDRTEPEANTGELDSARGFADAFRSQSDYVSNRLHTIVSLIEGGHTERALDVADELQRSRRLTDQILAVDEPALLCLLLGKAADANARGITFDIAPGSRWRPGLVAARDLVTIVANLIDNALDAMAEAPAERRVSFEARVQPTDGEHSQPYAVLVVSDSGEGAPADEAGDMNGHEISAQGQGTEGRRGKRLAIVAQSVARLGGQLEVSGPPGATFTVHLPVHDTRLPASRD